MSESGQKLALRQATALQIVCDQPMWLVLEACQEALEEPLGRTSVPPILNKDVQHHAVLIRLSNGLGRRRSPGFKKALAERVLNAKLDHHLDGSESDDRSNGCFCRGMPSSMGVLIRSDLMKVGCHRRTRAEPFLI
jgi:hypothetical protein